MRYSTGHDSRKLHCCRGHRTGRTTVLVLRSSKAQARPSLMSHACSGATTTLWPLPQTIDNACKQQPATHTP